MYYIMSKKLKFLAMMLTCILLSISQVRGADVNITASDLSGMGSNQYAADEKTVGDFTISATGCYGTTQFRLTQNKTLTITCNAGTMTAITFTTSSGYPITASNLTSQAWSSTTGEEAVSFTHTASRGARITNIAITYSSSGTTYTVVLEDMPEARD